MMKQDSLSRRCSTLIVLGREPLRRSVSTRSQPSRFMLRLGFPLLLIIILFGQMLGTGTIAQAAVHPPVKLPVAQVKMTLQQFLKQSVSYKASTAPPLVPGSTQALPILNTVKSTLPAQKPLP